MQANAKDDLAMRQHSKRARRSHEALLQEILRAEETAKQNQRPRLETMLTVDVAEAPETVPRNEEKCSKRAADPVARAAS